MMPEEPKSTSQPDNSRINLNQYHDVSYWMDLLGITSDELRRIVNKVGTLVTDVKKEALSR